jgi:hypothetical protein
MKEKPTRAALWRQILDMRLRDVHTSLPGKVVAVDPTGHTVDVQPQIKHVVEGPDEEAVESYPTLLGVPVGFMRAGGFYCAIMPAIGDFVTLICHDTSLGNFLATGIESDPLDYRSHSLAGAVAYPMGPHPFAFPITETLNGLQIGHDGGMRLHIKADGTAELSSSTGSSDFVALETLAKAELQALVDSINDLKGVFNAWVPSFGDGGTALKTAITTYASTPQPAAGAVGSTKVKAEE